MLYVYIFCYYQLRLLSGWIVNSLSRSSVFKCDKINYYIIYYVMYFSVLLSGFWKLKLVVKISKFSISLRIT